MWLGMSLAVGTLVSEDASSVGAGVLVAARTITPLSAIAWVSLGIWLGDLGLFAIGRGARRVGPLARWIDRRWTGADLAHAAARLDRGVAVAVFISRFVPGTRLPLYLASGVLPVSSMVFAASTFVASAMWSTVIVLSVAAVGRWW